jgi:hypothetical protein
MGVARAGTRTRSSNGRDLASRILRDRQGSAVSESLPDSTAAPVLRDCWPDLARSIDSTGPRSARALRGYRRGFLGEPLFGPQNGSSEGPTPVTLPSNPEELAILKARLQQKLLQIEEGQGAPAGAGAHPRRADGGSRPGRRPGTLTEVLVEEVAQGRRDRRLAALFLVVCLLPIGIFLFLSGPPTGSVLGLVVVAGPVAALGWLDWAERKRKRQEVQKRWAEAERWRQEAAGPYR